jgi:hypothetical protein
MTALRRGPVQRTTTVGLVAACIALAAPAAAEAAWTAVSTPNRGYGSELTAVAADSATDAWGVGQWFDTSTRRYRTLAEHWNGTAWALTTSVDPMTNQQLNGVAAVSPSAAFAVGFTNSSNWLANRTLIERWNSGWTHATSPSPTTIENELWGVWAASASDVWAVGNYGTSGGGEKTLIEHFDGTSWTVVPSPNATAYDNLHRVAGSSPTDVWAVGTAYNSATDVTAPLVEHWDGMSWKIVPSPVLGPDSYLRGVAATSPSDAWIVGEWDGPAPTYTPHTLVLRWNGSKWSSVANPSGGAQDFTLSGVAAKTSSDAWIAGDAEDYATGHTHTLIEHWNGSSWNVVASPNPNASYDSLDAATILPSGVAWMTGSAGSGSLALRNVAG